MKKYIVSALMFFNAFGMVNTNSAFANPPNNCSGDACDDIDLTFGPNGYVAENVSDGRRIEFTINFGMMCPAGASVKARILPGKTKIYNIGIPMYCATKAIYVN